MKAVVLNQGEVWSKGTAWVFDASIRSSDGFPDSFTAFKGTYEFLRPANAEPNLIILKLAFQREYSGKETDSGEIDWKLSTRFEPIGTIIEIPLDDGIVVPEDRLVLSVIRAFYVDANGNEMEKRYAPSGIIEEIVGTDVKRVRSLPFAEIGETLNVRPGGDKLVRMGLDKNPPPSFRVRAAERRTTAYRPAESLTGNAALAKERRDAALKAFQNGDYGAALTAINESIRLEPIAWSYNTRATCYLKRASYRNAIADFRQSLKMEPENVFALNGAAWILATCPQSNIRDGNLAIEYAKKACALTGYTDGFYLDTLAAAYAESGDFENAVRWQTEALETIDDTYKEQAKSRLELFRQGKPARDP